MTTTAQQTARLDQLHAAVREARGRIHATAERSGSPLYEGAGVAWLTEQLASLFQAVTSKTARLCPHVYPTGPLQPLSAATWDPGRLYCMPCARRLPPLDPIAERTCDRCARVVDPIYSGAAQIGLILIGWGLCGRCCRETGMPMGAKPPRGAA